MQDLVRIPSEVINKLPPIEFKGQIKVVYKPEELDRVMATLMKEEILGFDTETKPAFKKGQSFPVSLIQLSTLNQSYIIQIKYTGMRPSLIRLLEETEIKKLGIAIRDDIRDLKRLAPEMEPGGFVDISKLAREKGIIQVGARTLAARYFSKKLSKSVQVSNWARKHLTEKQIRYAATDAWVCLKLYPEILKDATDYRALAEAQNLSEI